MSGSAVRLIPPPPTVVTTESAAAAAVAPTLAQSGKTFSVTVPTDGIVITLPACAASLIGTNYRFVVTTVASTLEDDTLTINTASGDTFLGNILLQDTDAANAVSVVAMGAATVGITAEAAITVGTVITVVMVSSSQWHVEGLVLATGIDLSP